MKILLIDDDISFQKVIKESLENEGYEVVCALDGKAGLILFEQEKPDLVITDIIMPKMDGMEFIFLIMNKKQSLPCKIIAISGGGHLEGTYYIDAAKGAGVDDILNKPFRMAELLARVEALLSR